jgi:hypothetical protein
MPAGVSSQAGMTVSIRVFRWHPYPAILALEPARPPPDARLCRSLRSVRRPERRRRIFSSAACTQAAREFARSRIRWCRRLDARRSGQRRPSPCLLKNADESLPHVYPSPVPTILGRVCRGHDMLRSEGRDGTSVAADGCSRREQSGGPHRSGAPDQGGRTILASSPAGLESRKPLRWMRIHVRAAAARTVP